MRVATAILLGLAVIAGQLAHGAALVPFLAMPAYALLVAAAVLALFAQAGAPMPPVRVTGFGLAIVGYVAWWFWNAPDRELGRIDLGQFLAYGVAAGTVAIGVNGRVSRLWLFGIILVAALIQGAFGVFQMTSGVFSEVPFWFSEELRRMYFGRFSNRARGLFPNPNQFAWLMNVAALLALGLGVWGRVRPVARIVLIYLAAVFAALTILSASRGGMISLAAGLVVFLGVSVLALLVSVRRGRGWMLGGGFVALMISGGAAYWMFASNWVAQGRVDTLLTPGVRELLVEHAFRMFQESPLWGGGPGMFLYAARIYRTSGMPHDAVFTHNDWLQYLAEYGYVGALLLLCFFWFLLALGVRAFLAATKDAVSVHERPTTTRGGLIIGALAALCAGFVHSLTDFNMHIAGNGIVMAIVIGILINPLIRRGPEIFPEQVARGFAVLGLVLMGVGLGAYVWRFAPGDLMALRADNALRRGDLAAAISLGERGRIIDPNSPRVAVALGRAYFDYEASLQFAGDEEEFEELIVDEEEGDAAEDEGESDDDALVTELSPAERLAYFEKSAAAFSAAVSSRPRERSFRVEYSAALWEIGKDDAALAEAKTAVARDPIHGYTWGNLADLLIEAGREEDALRILDAGSVVDAGESNLYEAEALREELGIAASPEEVE